MERYQVYTPEGYFSISMATGKPKFIKNYNLGYIYDTKEQAEGIASKFENGKVSTTSNPHFWDDDDFEINKSEKMKYAKGGKPKDLPVIRTQFEEEEFEYADGGKVWTMGEYQTIENWKSVVKSDGTRKTEDAEGYPIRKNGVNVYLVKTKKEAIERVKRLNSKMADGGMMARGGVRYSDYLMILRNNESGSYLIRKFENHKGETVASKISTKEEAINKAEELSKKFNLPIEESYKTRMMAMGGRTSGRHRKPSLEERAEQLVGSSTWHELDKKTQAGLISEMILDGTLPQKMAKGAVVTSSISVTFTLSDGKKETREYATQDEADEGIANFIIDFDVEDVKINEAPKPEPKVEKAEAKPKKSLFEMAAKKPEPKSAKSKTPEESFSNIQEQIARYDALNAIIKNAKAEQEIIGGTLKEMGADRFLEVYEQTRRRPDNFNMVDGGESILFMVTDKYKKVTPEKEQILSQFPDLLGIDTTYTFDTETLEKTGENGEAIGDIINDLIINSDDISDEDKARLLKVERKVAVKKGTINRLLDYDNPQEIFNLIEPVLALK